VGEMQENALAAGGGGGPRDIAGHFAVGASPAIPYGQEWYVLALAARAGRNSPAIAGRGHGGQATSRPFLGGADKAAGHRRCARRGNLTDGVGVGHVGMNRGPLRIWLWI